MSKNRWVTCRGDTAPSGSRLIRIAKLTRRTSSVMDLRTVRPHAATANESDPWSSIGGRSSPQRSGRNHRWPQPVRRARREPGKVLSVVVLPLFGMPRSTPLAPAALVVRLTRRHDSPCHPRASTRWTDSLSTLEFGSFPATQLQIRSVAKFSSEFSLLVRPVRRRPCQDQDDEKFRHASPVLIFHEFSNRPLTLKAAAAVCGGVLKIHARPQTATSLSLTGLRQGAAIARTPHISCVCHHNVLNRRVLFPARRGFAAEFKFSALGRPARSSARILKVPGLLWL